MVHNPPLSQDPLWPRAGSWPHAETLAENESVDVALVGVPASKTSLSPTQAHHSPDAIRDALQRYSPALIPVSSMGRGVGDLQPMTVVDYGNIPDPDSPEGEERTRTVVALATAKSQLVVALGGDNSITVATALGAWGEKITTAGLITLDAHYDLRDGISNGSPVRRLIESGLDPQRIVQIGIQDFANSAAYAHKAQELGITVIHRDVLLSRPIEEVMDVALKIAGSAGGPIHVDLDVDVCDRAVAPACPASVPGGISAIELRKAARTAALHSQVRSLDITEIDASADSADGRTIRLAALCVLEALAGVSQR